MGYERRTVSKQSPRRPSHSGVWKAVSGLEEYLDLGCVRRVLQRWGARYAVVYGSVARGEATGVSDVDVAVKLGRRTGLRERGLLHVELEECLRGGRRLDLAFLDDGDPVLAWEALSGGVLIYSCGAECTREYYDDLAWALDMVADMEPLLRLLREERRRALARARG